MYPINTRPLTYPINTHPSTLTYNPHPLIRSINTHLITHPITTHLITYPIITHLITYPITIHFFTRPITSPLLPSRLSFIYRRHSQWSCRWVTWWWGWRWGWVGRSHGHRSCSWFASIDTQVNHLNTPYPPFNAPCMITPDTPSLIPLSHPLSPH